jgi:hypothetical protein
VIAGAGAVRVDQRLLIAHEDAGVGGGDAQGGGVVGGDRRTDFNFGVEWGKAVANNVEGVDAEGQLFGGGIAAGVGVVGIVELIGFADERDDTGHRGAAGIPNFEVEFADVALRQGGGGAEEE